MKTIMKFGIVFLIVVCLVSAGNWIEYAYTTRADDDQHYVIEVYSHGGVVGRWDAEGNIITQNAKVSFRDASTGNPVIVFGNVIVRVVDNTEPSEP